MSSKLGLLGLQLFYCSGNTQLCLRAHMRPVIQDPIDSGGAKTRLPRDLLDWKTVCHLMCF
ncbi:MAG: hypothetical protein EpisKO_03740 [Epibacterium sp.]